MALYDGNRLCDIKTEVYNGKSVLHETDKQYTSVKTMVWSDLNTQTPIIGAEKK